MMSLPPNAFDFQIEGFVATLLHNGTPSQMPNGLTKWENHRKLLFSDAMPPGRLLEHGCFKFQVYKLKFSSGGRSFAAHETAYGSTRLRNSITVERRTWSGSINLMQNISVYSHIKSQCKNLCYAFICTDGA